MSHRLSPVVRAAPAKLNLTLAVVGRADDRFHSLHGFFQYRNKIQWNTFQFQHAAFQAPGHQQAVDQDFLTVQFIPKNSPIFLSLFFGSSLLN